MTSLIKRRPILQQHLLTEREQKSVQILEIIRKKGPLTRTELSQATGFNIVTVSNYINQFIENGLVVEKGLDVSTGGRKPVLVQLNAKSGYVVGLDLGQSEVLKSENIALITDLKGEIVHRITAPRTMDSIEKVLGNARGLIRELLDTSPVDTGLIRGIGIGIPGIIDERAGTVRNGSRFSVRTSYVSVRDAVENEFNVPVLVGNDATLSAYGEISLGLEQTPQNAVYMRADLGTGLFVNGNLYWGSGGGAGELGVFLGSDDDYLQWLEQPSFLIPRGGDLGVVAATQKLVEEGHETLLKQLCKGVAKSVDFETVLQALQEGDPLTTQVIEDAAMQLGIRTAFLVNLLNPEVVIIGGGVEKMGSVLLESLWRAVNHYAVEEAADLVDVLPGKFGDDVCALGAACWVIREVFVQA